MGRARKRARRAAAGGLPPAAGAPGRAPYGTAASGPARAAGTAPDGERPIDDPEWRRAERRRIARLNRLPDPVRSWADRSRGHAAAAAVLQMLVAIGITLPGLKLATGEWLPPWAAIAALAVAVSLQAACRAVNRRADRRAEQQAEQQAEAAGP